MSDQIKFWRYYVPNIDGEGWGIFVLDSTGFFSAVTDYGNCAFRWSSTGTKDFREFMKGSPSYYINKLFGEGKEYQGDQTVEKIKRYIIECRREDSLTEEQARHEWDLMDQNDNLYSISDFTRYYDSTNLDDVGEFYTMGYSASVMAFGKVLLPRLFEMIKDDLATEKNILAGAPHD